MSGWDMAMIWRRTTLFPFEAIIDVCVVTRGELEPLVDHRVVGVGTHDGKLRPGKRRVGTMLGRGTVGKQFWAVGFSGPELQLLVLELDGHQFARAVLNIDDPEACRLAVADALGR